MEDLGKEVDEYFAKKYPLETKKILCHQCGGAVDNSLQQLKAEIADLIADIGEPVGNSRTGIDIRSIIERLRQLSAV